MNKVSVKGSIATVKLHLNIWLILIILGFIGFLSYEVIKADEPRVVLIVSIVLFVGMLTARVVTKFDRKLNKVTFRQSVFGIAMNRSFEAKDVDLVSILVWEGRFPVLCLRDNMGKRFQIAASISEKNHLKLARKLEAFMGIKYEGYI